MGALGGVRGAGGARFGGRELGEGWGVRGRWFGGCGGEDGGVGGVGSRRGCEDRDWGLGCRVQHPRSRRLPKNVGG